MLNVKEQIGAIWKKFAEVLEFLKKIGLAPSAAATVAVELFLVPALVVVIFAFLTDNVVMAIIRAWIDQEIPEGGAIWAVVAFVVFLVISVLVVAGFQILDKRWVELSGSAHKSHPPRRRKRGEKSQIEDQL
jgi:hypothetical protein